MAKPTVEELKALKTGAEILVNFWGRCQIQKVNRVTLRVLVVDAERLAWFAANAVNACATGRLSVKVPLFAVLEVL